MTDRTDREARAIERVRCSKCKQPKGQPCVYVEIKVLPLYARSPKTLARQALTGTPTKRQHNERLHDLWRLETEDARNRWLKEHEADMAEAKSTHEARMAYGAAVRQETQQLVRWLRQYGRILWESRDDWFPQSPEMCGQCGNNDFKQTVEATDPGMVMVAFTCVNCGTSVARFGYDPARES